MKKTCHYKMMKEIRVLNVFTRQRAIIELNEKCCNIDGKRDLPVKIAVKIICRTDNSFISPFVFLLATEEKQKRRQSSQKKRLSERQKN